MNIQPLFFTSQFEFQKVNPAKFLKETETIYHRAKIAECRKQIKEETAKSITY